MARSLRGTPQGIKEARIALDSKGLTQRALEVEYRIASWSTISKFFNGKPVERGLFIQICEALDLDWERVAGFEKPIDDPPSDKDARSLLALVKSSASAAREALNPRILERIDRAIVREKYLGVIERSIAGTRRIIPIIAPAGYGKSTILGSIYDELVRSPANWIALAPCNSLVVPDQLGPEELAAALGACITGQSISIVEVVASISAEFGRGVLLIDTLDLVVSRLFISAFNGVLRQLLEAGATVVLTCRDREYADYLEPARVKLAGLSEFIDRYNVPEFSASEIRLAATAFARKQNSQLSAGGEAFADKIINLSADNRSLQEITRNPLLLALLCDLFAKDGNVPPDLTTSKLYGRYWYEKVTYSRSDDSHSSLLAITKERFCLDVARALFDMSREVLCESAYLDELGLELVSSSAAAYEDLLSEGVLELLPNQKIHFFHQTLLEYAIAYWLNRRSSAPDREWLVNLLSESEGDSLAETLYPTDRLRQRDRKGEKDYWWPVMRQLLTLADYSLFEAIARQLGTDKLEAFRTVAFAAASRDEPDGLRWALPIALERGSAHQKVLQRALELASAPLAETAWEMMLALLVEGERKTASTIAQLIGPMLAGRHRTGDLLEQAIAAIETRFEKTGNHEERSSLCGWLIDSCVTILQENPDASALEALRKSYHLFSEKARVSVIALHLERMKEEGARMKVEGLQNNPSSFIPHPSSFISPFSARFDLLQQARKIAINKRSPGSLKEQLTKLLASLLPDIMAAGAMEMWQSWLDAIHVTLQDGFGLVQAKAVGYCAAKNQDILAAIVADLLTGEKQHTTNNLLAISATIEAGAAAELVEFVTSIDAIIPERMKSLGMLFKEAAPALDDSTKEVALQWGVARAEAMPELWLLALLPLGRDCAAGEKIIAQLLSSIPPEKIDLKLQKIVLINLPQLAPNLGVEIGDILSDKEQVEIYQKQAQGSSEVTKKEALLKLTNLSTSKSRKTALAASSALCQVLKAKGGEGWEGWGEGEGWEGSPHPPHSPLSLLPLLQSQYAGVRLNALGIIKHQASHQLLDVSQLEEVCAALSNEQGFQVLQRFCEIVANWCHSKQTIPVAVTRAIANIPTRLAELGILEAGVAGSLVDALNVIANFSDPNLADFLGQTTRCLLRSLDFKQVQESKTTALLAAIARIDAGFLPAIVNEDMPQFPLRNQHATVLAVKRVEGPDSSLLKYIAAQDWCHPEVKNLILSIQGA